MSVWGTAVLVVVLVRKRDGRYGFFCFCLSLTHAMRQQKPKYILSYAHRCTSFTYELCVVMNNINGDIAYLVACDGRYVRVKMPITHSSSALMASIFYV